MKVRAWLEDQGEIGKALVTPDSDLSCFAPSLLDAEVIGLPCKTCGGSKVIEKPVVADGETQTFSKEPCPDCADAPVYVIAPEAMEAFVCSRSSVTLDTDTKEGAWKIARDNFRHNRRSFEEWWEAQEASARRALQLLLPGARVATEVLTVHSPTADECPLVTSLHRGAVASGVEHYTTLCHGTDIAILAK